MKNYLLKSMCLLILLSLVACSKDDDTINVPVFSNQIQLDKTNVGTYQPVVFSISVPTKLPDGVYSVEYYFSYDDGLDIIPANANGVCSDTAYFTTSGNHTVYFHANYVFNGKDSQGNIFRNDVVSKIFAVKLSDARNSFWNDNLVETQRNCYNKLVASNDGTYYYAAGMQSFFDVSLVDFKTTTAEYFFNDDRLNQVQEINTGLIDKAFNYFYIFNDAISKIYGQMTSTVWSNSTLAVGYDELLQKLLNGTTEERRAAIAALNLVISSGASTFTAIYQTDATTLSLMFYISDNQVYMRITYLPK